MAATMINIIIEAFSTNITTSTHSLSSVTGGCNGVELMATCGGGGGDGVPVDNPYDTFNDNDEISNNRKSILFFDIWLLIHIFFILFFFYFTFIWSLVVTHKTSSFFFFLYLTPKHYLSSFCYVCG